MSELNLHIGQVLYVISPSTTKIVPVVVSECVRTETLNGDTVTWKVIIGPEAKRKVVDLKKVSGEKFPSLQAAKLGLLSQFETFLNETVEETAKNVKAWYNIDPEKVQAPKPTTTEEVGFDPESLINEINETPPLPAAFVAPPQGPRLSATDSPQERAAKLRAMATPDEDGNIPEVVGGTTKMIKLPDGQEIPVTIAPIEQ